MADYAGETPLAEEVESLRAIESIAPHLDDADPTNNAALKRAVQNEATRRAMIVAVELLRALPRGSGSNPSR